MSKSSRLFGFALLSASTLLICGALWSQTRVITQVELRQKRVDLNGKISVGRWQWRGEQARAIFDHFSIKQDDLCNICVNPTPSEELLTVTVSRRFGASSQQRINLESGQITPYQRGCLPQLTPQSLKYFQDLVTQTPPNGN